MQRNLLKDQRGFTLLEMMIVIVILGILATLAIPKFSNSVALANTTKIQADLQTLNTAIAMHVAAHGKKPQNIKTDLAEYIDNIENLKPPQGESYLRTGEKLAITATAYELDSVNAAALCQGHALKEFGASQK
ncbi:type IV pilin protein [Pectinatus cerevisiiphilus]|uniref:General secretion pathway protein G n=1 Tax=Pectinatus cerevisiiphilus TaxID=86956 RepID=A0A4R3K8X2_9FIRM|nr:prepilin-type N-terminal cleavage/methylation domain-containing protein [Pectinatus cerevisiiphilus]TCS79345.1 general secretion pathway protein G [Pectinatus cerevisiiphilus]